MKRDLHAATIADPIQNSTRRRRDSDRGDTLVEVLIALVILGLAAVALLVAFATSMSASAEHRNIATYNEVLSTASQAVISAYQTTPSLFQCPVTYPNPTLPSPYSADTVTFGTGASVVQYWNGGAFQPGCLANVPEKITIGVTGIPSRYTNTFVVTLLSSSSATANTGTATSIAFSQAPAPTGGATSGVPLTNLSEPIIEILVNGAPDPMTCPRLLLHSQPRPAARVRHSLAVLELPGHPALDSSLSRVVPSRRTTTRRATTVSRRRHHLRFLRPLALPRPAVSFKLAPLRTFFPSPTAAVYNPPAEFRDWASPRHQRSPWSILLAPLITPGREQSPLVCQAGF